MRRIAAAGITIVLLLGVTALAACGGGGGSGGNDNAGTAAAGRQYAYQSGGDREFDETILMVENDGRWALVDWSRYGGVIGGEWTEAGDGLEFTGLGSDPATAKSAGDDPMTLTFDAAENVLGGTVWSASGEPAMKGDEAVGVYAASGGTDPDLFPESTISLYGDGSWMVWGMRPMPVNSQPGVVWGGVWIRSGFEVTLDSVAGGGRHEAFTEHCTLEGDTLTMTWAKDDGQHTAVWTRQ